MRVFCNMGSSRLWGCSEGDPGGLGLESPLPRASYLCFRLESPLLRASFEGAQADQAEVHHSSEPVKLSLLAFWAS